MHGSQFHPRVHPRARAFSLAKKGWQRRLNSDVATGHPVIGIVDDDRSVRTAVGRLVRSHGFAAEVFPSGEELLRSDRLTSFSCLIVDVAMPGLSGLELQDRLAADGCPLPIIFITALDDAHIETRALAAGASGFLSKPFDDEELLAAIRTALGD
ncbi:MAG: response regulator [Gemmatimonadetes bacterium]|nr:response regulator [Gemmatimonadota bacterium]